LLNRCEALGLREIKLNGRTKPLVIDCEYTEDNIPIRKTLLVKTMGLPEITNSALYCELLGNILARDFGIETPEPFVVEISDKFVEATKNVLWEKDIKIASGLGVGCEYFSQGFTSVKPNTYLNRQQLDDAVLIYGFDLISQNPDRRETNPNCASKGEKIIAFDFEKSLSFIYPILGTPPEPWEFSKLNLSGNEKHVFHSVLKAKEKEIDWQPILERVKQINQEKVGDFCSLLPSEFGNYANEIWKHFSSIISNKEKLIFELKRSLL
jgi:hypothetical protein